LQVHPDPPTHRPVTYQAQRLVAPQELQQLRLELREKERELATKVEGFQAVVV